MYSSFDPSIHPSIHPSGFPSLPFCLTGWLTLGPNLSSSNFHRETYLSFFEGENGFLLSQEDEIETLRPKTPPPKSRGGGRGGISGGIGRGTVMGRGYSI